MTVKRRVLLSSGHSNAKDKDKGANYNGISEGELAVKLKRLIEEGLRERKIPVLCDLDHMVTKEAVAFFDASVQPTDIAIDLHFNASASHKGTGTEAVIPDDYTVKEIDLAKALTTSISEVLQIRNRGVITEEDTPRKQLMWMTLDCTTIILEVCFIDNMTDIDSFNAHIKQVAVTICNTLSNYVKL